MKRFLAITALLMSLHNYAQINFEKGYFIDNNNVRKECFIRNEDWKNNPIKFEYKASENDTSIDEKGINDVKEFGITDFSKFERFDVMIDASSVNINNLSEKKEPEWVKNKVFLKVIISGEASLYEYKNGNDPKYFYSLDNSSVEQLVYKRYTENNVDIKKNNDFQRQLWSKVKCEETTISRITKIEYRSKDLSEYFIEVNNCKGDKNALDLRVKASNNSFSFKIKGGINFNSLSINKAPEPTKYNPNIDFTNEKTYRFGFEVEYFLPFNKKKWSFFLEPTYQTKYASEKKIIIPYEPVQAEYNWTTSYSCLDFAIGGRHHMYINNNSKIFVSGSFTYSLKLNGTLGNEKSSLNLAASNASLAGGLGYSYKNYNIEFRYSKRDILDAYPDKYSRYKNFSIIVGYTLFETNKKK